MHTKKCVVCSKKFKSEKTFAVFCSNACKMKDARSKRNAEARNLKKGIEVFDKQLNEFRMLLGEGEFTKKELEKIVKEIRRKAVILQAIAKALLQKQTIEKLKRDLDSKY